MYSLYMYYVTYLLCIYLLLQLSIFIRTQNDFFKIVKFKIMF